MLIPAHCLEKSQHCIKPKMEQKISSLSLKVGNLNRIVYEVSAVQNAFDEVLENTVLSLSKLMLQFFPSRNRRPFGLGKLVTNFYLRILSSRPVTLSSVFVVGNGIFLQHKVENETFVQMSRFIKNTTCNSSQEQKPSLIMSREKAETYINF